MRRVVGSRFRTLTSFQNFIGLGHLEALIVSLRELYDLERIALSGSLVNGFGNAGSDIDLVVVDDGRRRTEPDRWRSAALGRYVDILPIPMSEIRDFIDAWARPDRFDEGWRPRRHFEYRALELLHRFRIAISLTEAAFHPAERRQLDEALPRYLAASFYRDAAAYWTDMVGASASGDAEQIFEIAAIIGRCLVGAAAALGDETATHEKWLAKKARRCGPPFGPIAQEFLALTHAALCRRDDADGLMRAIAAALCAVSAHLAGIDDRAAPVTDVAERFEYGSSGLLHRVTLADHEATLVRD